MFVQLLHVQTLLMVPTSSGHIHVHVCIQSTLSNISDFTEMRTPLLIILIKDIHVFYSHNYTGIYSRLYDVTEMRTPPSIILIKDTFYGPNHINYIHCDATSELRTPYLLIKLLIICPNNVRNKERIYYINRHQIYETYSSVS